MLEFVFAKATLPKTGTIAVPLSEGAALTGLAAALDKALAGAIKRAIEAAEFTGKKAQSTTILAPGAGLSRIILVGLGKAEDIHLRGAEDAGGGLGDSVDQADGGGFRRGQRAATEDEG